MLNIKFEKLFDRFNYNIELNPEGLTILTGPNGYGKSTILKCIEAIGKEFSGINFFINLDFKKIEINFKSGENIHIEKEDGYLKINNVNIDCGVLQHNYEERLERLEHRRFLSKIDEEIWFDHRRNTKISLNEFIRSSILGGVLKEEEKILDLLQKMKQWIGNIYFIKEQRLIREGSRNRFDEHEAINVIEKLPHQFKELMQTVQQNYSEIANQLDSTYPNRLFKTDSGITESDYETKMQEMALKFEKLIKYDLSAMQEPINQPFEKEHAKALKVYIEDFEEKYHAYEDFIKKLDLYTDIINQRLSFKKMKISKELGIEIVDENGKNIELTQLSSGEKQEIVLFYDLIFRANKDDLLLIDEPEISLHIIWQKKFMDDLLKIIDYKGFNVVVATHSPQIISNHWDRQVDLGELYGQQFD